MFVFFNKNVLTNRADSGYNQYVIKVGGEVYEHYK